MLFKKDCISEVENMLVPATSSLFCPIQMQGDDGEGLALDPNQNSEADFS